MPRHPRSAPGGFLYHALNRGVAPRPLFEKDGDCDAFERVLAEALAEHPTRVLAYSLMPNHWHFILWPQQDGELTAFLRWLTHTHTQRWHAHYHTAGTGHSIRAASAPSLSRRTSACTPCCASVERNPLRAALVQRAEAWRWSSLWRRQHPDARPPLTLHPWPVPEPAEWAALDQPAADRGGTGGGAAVGGGCPFGASAWQKRTARRLGLEFTLRPRGRPPKSCRAAGQAT